MQVWRRGEGGGRNMMEGGGGGGVLTGTPALLSHALLAEPTPSALGPRGNLMSARKSMQRQQVQVNVEGFEGGIPVRGSFFLSRVVPRTLCLAHPLAPARMSAEPGTRPCSGRTPAVP